MNTSQVRKILYIITRADLAGAQVHLISLIRALKERYQVAVMCGDTGYLSEELAHMGVEFWHIPALKHNINPFKDLGTILTLVEQIQSIAPDLIHLHSARAGILGRVAAWLSGVPAVFTAHGWTFSDGVSLFQQRFFSTLT